MAIHLSICIPTYNRAPLIGDALESIIVQATEDTEIVISDNASTDNTRQVVGELQKRFPSIRYYCWDHNVGFDRNVMRVVELATGEYCWFVGSDDRIEPGGLQRVLEALETYPNLGGISLSYNEYNRDMAWPGIRYNPTLGRYNQDTLFESASDCLDAIGYYLGYFSGQVVNRRIWTEIAQKGVWQNYCNGFVHIYMNGMVLEQSSRWLFLYEPCVAKRVNDELLAQIGFYERLRFDIVGTDQAMRGFLKQDRRAYNLLVRQGISYHITTQAAHGKLNGLLDLVSLIRLTGLCIRRYYRYPIFWLKAFPVLIMPPCLIQPSRRIYQSTLKRVMKF
jgi:abequosyltransferase